MLHQARAGFQISSKFCEISRKFEHFARNRNSDHSVKKIRAHLDFCQRLAASPHSHWPRRPTMALRPSRDSPFPFRFALATKSPKPPFPSAARDNGITRRRDHQAAAAGAPGGGAGRRELQAAAAAREHQAAGSPGGGGSTRRWRGSTRRQQRLRWRAVASAAAAPSSLQCGGSSTFGATVGASGKFWLNFKS